jgi:hypothetical protein
MGGYPLAGEDASYSGLCSFNCNYGDCDPDACGTTEVNLIIPTVSEFAPPTCTSGTGEGNLAGLCSYSCGYGFCPINACTCTGIGGLVLPPVANDVSGYADPSVDAETYGSLCDLSSIFTVGGPYAAGLIRQQICQPSRVPDVDFSFV